MASMLRVSLVWVITSIWPVAASTEHGLPIHDGHIHYDQDVWQALPPEQAVELLAQQGIRRALVSATPAEGAAMLYRVAPEQVIPMLRPYRSWRHRYFWFRDPGIRDFLLQHLASAPYRGFGEFHVFGDDMAAAGVRDMLELARQRGLVLHPHTDLKGMRILLSRAGETPVIWAHGGFDVPLAELRRLLDAHANLYIELSLREGLLDEDDELTPPWQALLREYPQRFLLGMDTYKPSRWAELPELAGQARHWLASLPRPVAEQIAYRNLDRLFPR